MKRITLLMLAMAFALFSFASDGPGGKKHLFQLDEAQLQEDFQELNQLETYLLENEMPTLVSLKTQADALPQFDLSSLSEEAMASPAFSIDDLDVVAFLWGLLCCPIGFFVVAINKNKGQDSKTSFWIGALISFLVGGSGFWGIRGRIF